MTKPETKYDTDKPRWDLLPLDVLEEIVDVLTFGANKYSDNGWKKVPDAERRYYSALLRHLKDYQRGIKNDEETGKSHLAHAGCCLLFLLAMEKNG